MAPTEPAGPDPGDDPPKFPCSIAEASRRLKVNADTLGILVTAFAIRTRPSPRNGRAKLLTERSFRKLARVSKPFWPVPLIDIDPGDAS